MLDRRRFIGFAAAGATLWAAGGPARAALVAGRDFVPISQPLATESGGKIEMLEFFWYGCPHCFDLEPLLNRWKQKMPADVAMRRVPGIFRDSWVPGARTFYALESLGELERLHGELFNAVHIDKLASDNEKAILDWVARKGVDRKKFEDAAKSFAVESKVSRAKQLTRASRIEGVPALIVDGRYLATAQTHEAMLGVVDQLIAKVRSDRSGKA